MKYNINLTFLIFLILLATVSSVFAQTKEHTPQKFGEDPLVALDFGYNEGDSLMMYITPSADLIELIVISAEDELYEAQIERHTEFAQDLTRIDIRLSGQQEVYIRTKEGVTSVHFFNELSRPLDGHLLLNGELIAVFENTQPVKNLDGLDRALYKDKLNWFYQKQDIDQFEVSLR